LVSLLNVFKVIKSKGIKLMGKVACVVEDRNTYNVLMI